MFSIGFCTVVAAIGIGCYIALMMKLDLERAIGEIIGMKQADKTAQIEISDSGFVLVNLKNGNNSGYSIAGLATEIKKNYSWLL
ncbi:hypothetical protein [Photobacterium damselae]|uniref:hypothetical protein n=1 Tax=Photobacterium damselae TaxID=38293 RepID=UPI00406779E0